VVQRRTGFAVSWQTLSPILGIFRVQPAAGGRFPDYEAGQYIALRREDCALTRRVTGADGRTRYVPDVDASGRQRRGPVSHAYSISSAPYETAQEGFLEFYVVRETDEDGRPGRLTESLFRIEPGKDDEIVYFDRIAGDFTLAKRAAGFPHVLMVASGSGLAPFVSMIKQLHFEAGRGPGDPARYTLLHGNRTAEELAYHRDLETIAAAGRLDFTYLATVSRPASSGHDPWAGAGSATCSACCSACRSRKKRTSRRRPRRVRASRRRGPRSCGRCGPRCRRAPAPTPCASASLPPRRC